MKTKQTLLALFTILPLLLFGCSNGTAEEDCTITYEGNGGATSAGGTEITDAITHKTGDSVTLAPCEFYLSGYTFAHWNTLADNTGASYDDEATVTLSGNLVLYAIWTEKSATETLDGLTNKTITQYDYYSDGTTKRSLKEWSTSWDSDGTEYVDYYAVYAYSDDADTVITYADDSQEDCIAYYKYTKDSSGNITKAEWFDDTTESSLEAYWDGEYNSASNYTSYKYYTVADGVDTLDSYRTCTYDTTGEYYTEEDYYDEDDALTQSYVPTYLDEDPTTGIILKEVQTKYIDDADGDGEDDENITIYYMNYTYSYSYMTQMVHVDDDENIIDSYEYIYELVSGAWLESSELYLVANEPNSLDTYSYDSGWLSVHTTYDMLDGKQMSDKVSYSYWTEGDANYMSTSTYEYDVERGATSYSKEPPAFKTLAPSFKH